MQLSPIAETTRGGHVENIHFGSVAVVDVQGRLLWQAGDPHFMTFTRSALKPFQALPFILDGGHAQLGLEMDEVALLCASHSGEEQHVAGVRRILARAGMEPGDLACGCHAPLYYDTLGLRAPADVAWSPLQHNCSGKHAGFLAWCRLHGRPWKAYVDPDHALQVAVRARLADTLGIRPDAMPRGIDGCSAPNYALPLAQLALLFARLAQGEDDPQWGPALGVLRAAMTGYPAFVSGAGRSDLAWMEAAQGDWVAKAGADAVQALGVRSLGLGIAVKVADGAPRVLQAVVASVLEQLGLVTDAARAQAVQRYLRPPLRNWRGAVVGEIRPVVRLARAP
jgi:L-asparaginase II